MNCEREGAVSEYIVIMQILPGSSDNPVLINASGTICNVRRMHAVNETRD
jgi:hypothetical protein